VPKRTYRVTYDGAEYKRVTDRPCTHVVLVRRVYEDELDRVIKKARDDAKTNHYYAYKHITEYQPPQPWFSAEELAARRAESKRIATMPMEDYEAECVEKARADVDARRAKGEFILRPWKWCGRPDLAVKEETLVRRMGYWAEIVVVPVPQPLPRQSQRLVRGAA
jgi:hypothetical protein